eukprot:scaffold548_cov64-Phaeocystis_antarctica.AAC.2
MARRVWVATRAWECFQAQVQSHQRSGRRWRSQRRWLSWPSLATSPPILPIGAELAFYAPPRSQHDAAKEMARRWVPPKGQEP